MILEKSTSEAEMDSEKVVALSSQVMMRLEGKDKAKIDKELIYCEECASLRPLTGPDLC